MSLFLRGLDVGTLTGHRSLGGFQKQQQKSSPSQRFWKGDRVPGTVPTLLRSHSF